MEGLMERHKTKQRRSIGKGWGFGFSILAVTGFLGACATDVASDAVTDDTLLTQQPFVAISREGTEARARAVEQLQQDLRAAAPVGQPPARNGEFYLAISKAELGTK